MNYKKYGTTNFKKVAVVAEPVSHPRNCKNECAYGRNRAFCFPCYAKIISEYKKSKEKNERGDHNGKKCL